VFYAKDAYDIEYNFPFGFKELEGVHMRGDYDLTQHSKFSGADLSYRDSISAEKYIPHIIESSIGVGRLFLALICDGYEEEALEEGEVRTVLKIDKNLAPIKAAVFPLVKNKPELVEKAREIFNDLKTQFMCEFDDNGNIGKRYRRQDEIGTPFCITVDYDTIKDGTVTVRDRDTMEQERIKIDNLQKILEEKLRN
ncbi:MAG: His/Gly/Thr/Pro-type tRNA ligase C-terminal domain-containing protein, partial [bacterium]